MSARKGLLGLLSMLVLGAAHAATTTLPPGAILLKASTAKSDPARVAIESGAVLERVARGDDADALARLQKIGDPLAFELTAARVIDTLATTGGGDELLVALESVPPRVFRRHEETRSDWFLPVFDVAGKASSLRELRARRQRALVLRAELLSDATTVSKRGSDWPEAIALLSTQDVDRVADAILSSDAPADPGALVALAARSKRADIWDRALDAGEAVDVLPLFAQVETALSPAAAKSWTERASRDPRYASAAVFVRARLDGDALTAMLDDAARGPSAAAALAQREGDDFVARVDALVGAKASTQQLRHVALALRLIGTPAARERLHALAEDPRLPAHVRAELQR